MRYDEYRNAVIAKFDDSAHIRLPLTFEQIANLHQMGADIEQAFMIGRDIESGVPADEAFDRNL